MNCPNCRCEMYWNGLDPITHEVQYNCPLCFHIEYTDGTEEPVDDIDYDDEKTGFVITVEE